MDTTCPPTDGPQPTDADTGQPQIKIEDPPTLSMECTPAHEEEDEEEDDEDEGDVPMEDAAFLLQKGAPPVLPDSGTSKVTTRPVGLRPSPKTVQVGEPLTGRVMRELVKTLFPFLQHGERDSSFCADAGPHSRTRQSREARIAIVDNPADPESRKVRPGLALELQDVQRITASQHSVNEVVRISVRPSAHHFHNVLISSQTKDILRCSISLTCSFIPRSLALPFSGHLQFQLVARNPPHLRLYCFH